MIEHAPFGVIGAITPVTHSLPTITGNAYDDDLLTDADIGGRNGFIASGPAPEAAAEQLNGLVT